MTAIEKLNINVKQANSDFAAIKKKIVEKGVVVAEGTRTAEYANKIDRVYEAGQKSMVDESKLIEKTVSGVGKVSLTDVSEIPHKIKVQLSSDTVTDFSNVTVKRLSANLITFPYTSGGIGTNTTYNGLTFIVNEDRSISINGTATKETYFGLGKVDLGTTAISSTNSNSGTNGEYSISKILFYNPSVPNLMVRIELGVTIDETLYPMANEGSVTLPYEPYREDTFTPNANGYIEIDRLSPNTRLTTDNADIKITATYYKSYGMQTERDRFWDNYQENGNRTDYRYAFGGFGWTNYVFEPKYNITPAGTFANSMFYCCGVRGDLVKILDDLGVKLDCSKATTFGSTFNSAYYITRIGVIGNENTTSIANCFIYCSGLITIDKVIINENTLLTNAFQGCGSLKNITFEGTIGQSIDIHWSKLLSKASIINIFEHLSSTASGKTLTLSYEAVISAFGSTDNEEWKALVASVPNWAVELA